MPKKRKLSHKNWAPMMPGKQLLHNYFNALGVGLPQYHTTQTGPDHAPSFSVVLNIPLPPSTSTTPLMVTAAAGSRKDAETTAALAGCQKLTEMGLLSNGVVVVAPNHLESQPYFPTSNPPLSQNTVSTPTFQATGPAIGAPQYSNQIHGSNESQFFGNAPQNVSNPPSNSQVSLSALRGMLNAKKARILDEDKVNVSSNAPIPPQLAQPTPGFDLEKLKTQVSQSIAKSLSESRPENKEDTLRAIASTSASPVTSVVHPSHPSFQQSTQMQAPSNNYAKSEAPPPQGISTGHWLDSIDRLAALHRQFQLFHGHPPEYKFQCLSQTPSRFLCELVLPTRILKAPQPIKISAVAGSKKDARQQCGYNALIELVNRGIFTLEDANRRSAEEKDLREGRTVKVAVEECVYLEGLLSEWYHAHHMQEQHMRWMDQYLYQYHDPDQPAVEMHEGQLDPRTSQYVQTFHDPNSFNLGGFSGQVPNQQTNITPSLDQTSNPFVAVPGQLPQSNITQPPGAYQISSVGPLLNQTADNVQRGYGFSSAALPYEAQVKEMAEQMASKIEQSQPQSSSASKEDVDEKTKGQDNAICKPGSLYGGTLGSAPHERSVLGMTQDPATQTAMLDSTLYNELKRKQGVAEYQRRAKARKNLTISAHEDEIISLINNNHFSLISGETGCGKTTQVPQFVLDSHIERKEGHSCGILVTQPRRLAAIAAADRVVYERYEVLGSTVGYQIGLEQVMPRKGASILYCTTGIVLRRLQMDPLLLGVSHVIVDEVHERDLKCDFFLTVLRELATVKRPDMRVVLMSATLNIDTFKKYLTGAPSLSVGGRLFPVEVQWLDDLKKVPQMQFLAGNAAIQDATKDDPDELNLGLCAATIVYLSTTFAPNYEKTLRDNSASKLGAILVFLPGWDEIKQLAEKLQSDPNVPFSNPAYYRILLLHSMLASAEQKRVFEDVPPGCRKIILATNIAETSITVNDVIYVVDAGRHKEKSHDPTSGTHSLKSAWISRANAEQRRGRAGRVRRGYCFRLFTKERENLMLEFQVPEMLRLPLHEVCLQIQSLQEAQLGNVDEDKIMQYPLSIAEFFSKCIQCPPRDHIISAVDELTDIGALYVKSQVLTPLGRRLAAFPTDPRIGKILLYASILGCREQGLGVAATLSWRSPFVIPYEKRAEAQMAHSPLTCLDRSDHLAAARAYSGWRKVVQEGGKMAGDKYGQEFWLSSSGLQMIDRVRANLVQLLINQGYANLNQAHSEGTKEFFGESGQENHLAALALMRGIVVSAFWPQVAERAKEKDKACRLSPNIAGSKVVLIHPSSVNYHRNVLERHISSSANTPSSVKRTKLGPFLVFSEKLQTQRVFLRETTSVQPLALALFAEDVVMQPPESGVEGLLVGGWLPLECEYRIAVLLLWLREFLRHTLVCGVRHPNATVSSLNLNLDEYHRNKATSQVSSSCSEIPSNSTQESNPLEPNTTSQLQPPLPTQPPLPPEDTTVSQSAPPIPPSQPSVPQRSSDEIRDELVRAIARLMIQSMEIDSKSEQD